MKENIMKMTLIRLLTISCLLAAGSLNSVAQEKKPEPDEAKVRAEILFKVIGAKFAMGKVVKGAPYSATAITESVQTLSDGNQIIRKNQSKIYRDSEGRTRTEQTLETIGKWAADGEARQSIFINDPVAGESYSLDPREHTAYKTPYLQKKLIMDARGGSVMVNGQAMTQAEFEALREKKQKVEDELLATKGKDAVNGSDLKKKIEMLQTGKPDGDAWKKESLGTQTIEGLTVEGARSTLTIPAGAVGNTLPIEVVDETWYSPELQITVMTRHRDPRSAETAYRLINIDRGEPDRSLFEVPAGYAVSEGKTLPKKKLTKEEE
jgi:cytochrome c556